jgi:hydrogenase maturation protease
VTETAAKNSVLLIGYGNDLRGDDAAGRVVAAQFAQRADGDIEVRSVHQLTPDLAAVMAEYDRVIFVDACSEPLDAEVRVRRVEPDSSTRAIGAHMSSPSALLGLAQALYGRRPDTWAIDIAASDFDLREGLSSRTEAAVDAAVRMVERLAAGETPSSAGQMAGPQ